MPSVDYCATGQIDYSDSQLNETFPRGFANANLEVNATTGRIAVSALQTHYNTLKTSGIIPGTPFVANSNDVDLPKQQANDQAMFNAIQQEYCFYESRYKYALRQFLDKATSRVATDNAAAQKYLTITIRLNRTLNSLIEIMSFMGTQRVSSTNAYVQSINTNNAQIEANRASLQATFDKLRGGSSGTDSILTVQKEMVEYTKQKNAAVTNQISLWAALNVLALGTIFYVYRSA